MADIYQELEKLLKQKRSRDFYAQRLGKTVEEIEELIQEIRNPEKRDDDALKADSFYDVDKGTLKIDAYYVQPPQPEQVIKDHKIDVEKWKLSSYYSKGKTKGWLVTALFTQKTKEEYKLNKFEEFLKTYKSSHNPLKQPSLPKREDFLNPVAAEISLADAHIDKWGLEGDSIDKHCHNYLRILKNLIRKAYLSNNIEEIIFVIGNDYFNTDNWHNGTTEHINIQDINARWDDAYEKGFDTLVKAVETLKEYAPKINIIVVNGNHDKQKSYYLGHALETYFKNDDSISFDRTSAPRKIHVYGNTAIMYHHGNCKIDDLPLTMASEFPLQWGATKFHRVHTGDKHFYMEKEIKGVRIKQYPSISQTDTWHNEKNYVLNSRVGLLNIFDRKRGRIMEYEESIEE